MATSEETKTKTGIRIRKYLIYAFGEIIIVAIGILIAFYLNNWYQENRSRKLEKSYYESMRKQLEEDKDIILGNIEYSTNFLSQFAYARTIIQGHRLDLKDTLGRIAFNLIHFPDFRRKSNVFQTLLSTGEIVDIRNRSITDALQNLEEIYSYVNRLEDNHASFILLHIIDDQKRTLQYQPYMVEDADYLYSYKFLYNFDFAIFLMEEEGKVYQQAINEIDSIFRLIDNELK